MKNRIKNTIIRMLPSKYYLQYKRYWVKKNNRHHFDKLQALRSGTSSEGYSFKPFDKTRSIFIHIPKCAGISVSDTLYRCHAGGHYSLDSYVNAFEPQNLLDYFKFAIVRNPWDRLVSSYHFLRDGGMNQGDTEFFERELSDFDDFDDFVKRWLSSENIRKRVHFHPQTDFILERNGKIDVNFVGYFENLDSDFEFIAKRIGCNRKLASKNRSNHKTYIDYYSSETRDLVAKIYSQDIEYLGYDFYNKGLIDVLSKRVVC